MAMPSQIQFRPLLLGLALFASSVVSSLAASGPYDEEDPFDEENRVERLQRLGWDLSQELDVEFYFSFSDRAETRERYARTFATKLRRMGYPQASSRPCANEKACWLVVAPKRLRVDLKKLIALSKQLDQLAADDYGRYDGWQCEPFNKEDEGFLAARPEPSARTGLPTLAAFLTEIERGFSMQCMRISENVDRDAEQFDAAGKAYESYVLRGFRDVMCKCAPDRARQTRAALQPAERDLPISEAEFTQRYGLPKVIEPCMGEMARKMYGENCAQVAASTKRNASTYCPCIRSVVAGLSDAELTQLGLASADYIPLAAQAQKDGKPLPEPPPLYKSFMEKEATCRN